MGGLSRRSTVLENQRKSGTTFVVDAGDLMWKSKSLPKTRLAQQRQKALLQLDIYADGGIDAMVPGEADLALGLAWVAKQAQQRALPYVAANLTCAGWDIPPGRVVERDGFKVAFVGVVGMSEAGPCTARSTVPAVKQAFKELGEADLHVLLSHQESSADAAIVRAVPSIDVVVNGHGRKTLPTPAILEGHAIQLAAGTRGKKVGVAAITLMEGATGFTVVGATEKLETRLVAARDRRELTALRAEKSKTPRSTERVNKVLLRLDKQIAQLEGEIEEATAVTTAVTHKVQNRLRGLTDDVADHPQTARKVEAAKEGIEAAAKALPPAKELTKDRAFVGDRMCMSCHAEQYAQWKSTPHAYAWSTLVKVKRSQDLDCYACHVTGAHHPEGPQTPRSATGLENVGCESCHGPGRKHVAQPSKSNITGVPDASVCTQCHDGVKDEGRFELDAYLPKVVH
jgi:2',3'-cyclic-nucleotide 2'-phosphodiesterase (5'-nucleotidase family)